MRSVRLGARFMLQYTLDARVYLRMKSEEKNTLMKDTRVGEEKKHPSKGNESRYFDREKEEVCSQERTS